MKDTRPDSGTVKPLILLYDATGAGLIICCESGVRISNQTGGTSCLQPEVEGIFVPLRNEYLPEEGTLRSIEEDLTQWFGGSKHGGSGATLGLDQEDADFIEGLLHRSRLSPAVSVDHSRLRDSHEAWVHVIIHGDETAETDLALFSGFAPYPRSGILTWSNSD